MNSSGTLSFILRPSIGRYAPLVRAAWVLNTFLMNNALSL